MEAGAGRVTEHEKCVPEPNGQIERQRKTDGEGKRLPIAQIPQAWGGGGGWARAPFRGLRLSSCVSAKPGLRENFGGHFQAEQG